MNYVERLMALGYMRPCAERIVSEYTESGKIDDLLSYIQVKEHVMEVLG